MGVKIRENPVELLKTADLTLGGMGSRVGMERDSSRDKQTLEDLNKTVGITHHLCHNIL